MTDVLVLFDALPPLLLGCYGGADPTPAIDELAADGRVFDFCFADGDQADPTVEDDRHVIELPGVPPVASQEFAAIEFEERDDLLRLAAEHLREHDRGSEDHFAALREIAAVDADAAETLLDYELTAAAAAVRDADQALAMLLNELPPDEVRYTLTAKRGWAATGYDSPLSDLIRHVPAIGFAADEPSRDSLLQSVANVLDGHTGQTELVFYAGDRGRALRTSEWLYIRETTDAGGEERLFAKPSDRFDLTDLSRQQPGVVDELSVLLRSRVE